MSAWGWWIGLPNSERMEQVRFSWSLPTEWSGALGWLCAVVAVTVAAWWMYRRQPVSGGRRAVLLGLRFSVLLTLLLFALDPQIRALLLQPRPRLVYWVLDNSLSMTLDDGLSESRRAALRDTVGSSRTNSTSRLSLARDWWLPTAVRLEQSLEASQPTDFATFLMANERGVPLVPLGSEENGLSGPGEPALASWNGAGEISPIGEAIDHAARRMPLGRPDALIVVSDFAANEGKSAIDVAQQLGKDTEHPVQIFAIGLGPSQPRDVAVDLILPGRFKRAERATIRAVVQQHGFDAETIRVTLTASGEGGAERRIVEQRDVQLVQAQQFLEFEWVPMTAGSQLLTLQAAELPREATAANNQAQRRVSVTDDFLRVGFVAYEPTWEWRFVKEVFHRDPLVGLRGFRTYLQSSSPQVRERNTLFWTGLVRPRSEFFETDVYLLSDLPASALSTRFASLLREFVADFGGGLVILTGPRFGPQPVQESVLSDLLPVSFAPDVRRLDSEPFTMRLTADALRSDFMRLGRLTDDAQRIWDRLEGLEWFFPVDRVHPLATVLATHPTQRCPDGQPQPLIASRPIGRGLVVWVAHDELWRLRREAGELYYRQFWSQLLSYLALGHPLGASKRFQLTAEPRQSAPGDTVTFQIEAYDEDYQPWTEAGDGQRPLRVQWYEVGGQTPGPETDDGQTDGVPLGESRSTEQGSSPPDGHSATLTPLAPGRFEGFAVMTRTGLYQADLLDPSGSVVATAQWRVATRSQELQEASRNVQIQQQLASMTGGLALELDEVDQIARSLSARTAWQQTLWQKSLWQTPLAFVWIVGCLAMEWLLRFRWKLR